MSSGNITFLNIELREIDSVKPYERNPRLNHKAVDAVAASLKEFGFRQPIVVDSDGIIVVGHTRYRAALELGLQKIPVHVATDLTPEQIRAYRIADNKTAELSEWDFDILPIELSELKDIGFDMKLLAFGDKELTKLLNMNIEQGLTDPDEVPEPPDEPVTQRGDVWILDNHRLMCGDSANPQDVDKLLDGIKVHLFHGDPPYNVAVESRSNNSFATGQCSFTRDELAPLKTTKLRAKDRPIQNDKMSDEDFDRMLDAWFGNIVRVLERVGGGSRTEFDTINRIVAASKGRLPSKEKGTPSVPKRRIPPHHMEQHGLARMPIRPPKGTHGTSQAGLTTSPYARADAVYRPAICHFQPASRVVYGRNGEQFTCDN